jgi:hypothetical protein
MRNAIVNWLAVGICSFSGMLLLCSAGRAQNSAMEQPLKISVQVLDGRNGKPLKNQQLLVFTGRTSDAVKSHAEHTGLITDKAGTGVLVIYPSETQWLQVFADWRVLCYPNANQGSFSVSEIMSKGVVTPNGCSAFMRKPTPGRFIVFARPAHLMERMKW